MRILSIRERNICIWEKRVKYILDRVRLVVLENDDNPLVIENEDDYGKLNDKNWSSIIVKEELFEEMRDELILNDYPHVQFIHIQEEAFKNITSLTISNLSELKYLTIENGSFSSTTSVTLSSIIYSCLFH